MSKEAAEAAISTKCDFANGAAELWTEPGILCKEAAEAAISTECDFANGAAELWTEPGILCKEAAGAAVSTKCDFANGAAELWTESKRPNIFCQLAGADLSIGIIPPKFKEAKEIDMYISKC